VGNASFPIVGNPLLPAQQISGKRVREGHTFFLFFLPAGIGPRLLLRSRSTALFFIRGIVFALLLALILLLRFW
jgi:hypothetical protein